MKPSSHASSLLRWTCAVTLGLGLLVLVVADGSAGAGHAKNPTPGCPVVLDLAGLKTMSLEELDGLFTHGTAVVPQGKLDGAVLCMEGYRCPRTSKCIANAFWKGKEFSNCGDFINQFCCFQALSSYAIYGRSWFDGCPCVVLEYPSHTPLFGPLRDELRQIHEGLYIARAYQIKDREFRFYLGLECPHAPCPDAQPAKHHTAP